MIVTALVLIAPALIAYLAAPAGGAYLGYQLNTDDHMVYAAWMRQAVEGRVLFENRFAVDPQPGLTLHVYFLILGWVAKVTGIVLATHLARVGFGVLFIWLLHRFLLRMELQEYTHKLALATVTLGGGLGFMVWHTFGQAIVKPAPPFLAGAMRSRLPIDVWQPEAFVLPSLLTNSLFAVSLCLIMGVLICVLDARQRPQAVIPGAICMALLMNIHSYDVLLITLTLVAFLGATLASRTLEKSWLVRAVVIGLGAIPPALWFVYVLRNDPVFQARAATETFSPNFVQVIFGILPLFAFGLLALAKTDLPDLVFRRRWAAGALAVLVVVLWALSGGHTEGYFLSPVAWGVVFAAAVGIVVLGADRNPAFNLVLAWAVVGLVAIYFPALFQRKLAMGLAVPWGILAAVGFAHLIGAQARSARNLATVLVLIIFAGSSLRWVTREITLARNDVSTTTVHPVYLSPDALRIVNTLEAVPGRKIVVAVPGRANPLVDSTTGQPVPDEFGAPLVPDLNPVLTGLAGATTYAGHWSETPDYLRRRGEVERLFFTPGSLEEKRRELAAMGADYLVTLVPDAYPGSNLPDLRPLGELVVDGNQIALVKIAKTGP